mgnify:CR=1 FL=1
MEQDKALSLFRLGLNGVFEAFHGYGYDIFIPEAIAEIMKLALVLHKRLEEER